MSHTLKSLRALADPTRLRLMALLERDELSVNELQQISRLGQSRISTHLRQLQEAELLQSRREGKRTFYRLRQAPTRWRRTSSSWPSGEPRKCTKTPPINSTSNASLPAAANKPSFTSTRSPAVSIAATGRAAPGKPLGKCSCASFPRWSWPISAPAKGCSANCWRVARKK